ncbi:MAG: helix-turn-helix transcriptional regulator [Eggerthellaceae bacterium]
MGLSQEELAERIYVSRQTISNWETDKTYPDIKPADAQRSFRHDDRRAREGRLGNDGKPWLRPMRRRCVPRHRNVRAVGSDDSLRPGRHCAVGRPRGLLGLSPGPLRWWWA